jgi:hypothetical protein
VAVLDKFVRAGRPPLVLRALNLLARVLFSDLTRRFEDILAASGTDLEVERDEPVLLGGLYRTILLRKRG